ncbi:MAG: PIG-L family deacetylase [Myxococcota bacterium]
MTTSVAWWIGAWAVAFGQDAGGLLTEVDQLGVVGSVLYVAAHPDDENTRLIHWLGRERGLRTAYLSMTRGGGGQNLIGSERTERLSVLRTGELLAARAIDGGQQLFTRMRDFGYSKSPEETLALWGRDEALDDVIRAIRTFRPDIIVTRFSADGGGHGHHTASARLAAEAFERAADPTYEMPGLPPWQARRLLRNESTWRLKEDDPIPEAWMGVDVGTYDPRAGQSAGEVAARARSQHKSQGFGSAPRIGVIDEYFTLTAGEPVVDGDPFGGLDLSWSRFDQSKRVTALLEKIGKRFDLRAPETVLPLLARLHRELDALEDGHWRQVKQRDVEQLMRHCAGIYLSARTSVMAAAPGDRISVVLRAAARREGSVELRGVEGPSFASEIPSWTAKLGKHPAEQTVELVLDADAPISQPHWLITSPTPTRYAVDDPEQRLIADRPPVAVTMTLDIAGVRQAVDVTVVHAITDRVRGEVLRPFEVLPRLTTTFGARGVLVPRGGSVEVPVTLTAPTLTEGTDALTAAWTIEAPVGITVTPTPWPVTLTPEAPERVVHLRIMASDDATAGPVTLRIAGEPAYQRHRIAYPHVPERTVLATAALRVTPVSLDRGAVTRVGYLPGSGDDVAEVLLSVGYNVEILDETQLTAKGLQGFDAVVFGVRAYNTRPGLIAHQSALLEYVAGGGTLIVQYNTSRRWTTLSDAIGPAALQVGRGRVTDEMALVTLEHPKHPMILGPNRLTEADFEGWVQERGLYFAESWDDAYVPLFSMADPGEDAQLGSTLVAAHGKGTFIYTGLSFFRQLPEGIPGAMRLFANLLAGANPRATAQRRRRSRR